ncbi:MAG: helix-turn-helix transcriptional regulator [Gemmatimonadetes bacterium]|nr:helix-turn-helix transcriptional regulator [Gemmatimonadota bacterium]
MNQGDLFQRTLALLQGAALDDRYWLSAAARFNEATGTRGHAIGFGAMHPSGDAEMFLLRFVFGRQRREDWERVYTRDYMLRDERWLPWSRLPSGQVVPTRELLTESERKRSAVYNEMLRDIQALDGLTVLANGPTGTRIGVALADSVEMTGWSSGQIEVIERLSPHVVHSICVRQALVDARAHRETLSGLLDNTRTSVFQLDRRGRVVEANDLASEMLRRGRALIAPRGFLRATRQADNAEIQQLLAGALPPFGGQAVGGSMVIRSASPAKTLIVHVNPVGAELRDGRTHRIAAIVLAVKPGSRVWVDPDLVASALGLTPAESQVAAMLAAGDTVADIARATGRKDRSVHWHLQQIFRKQGIGRQAELVRRVLSIQTLAGTTSDPESRRSRTDLTDA